MCGSWIHIRGATNRYHSQNIALIPSTEFQWRNNRSDGKANTENETIESTQRILWIMCFARSMWYRRAILGDVFDVRMPVQTMADYIDNNSCHIDQTADVIDEVDILGTYTTMQEHQNDEIIASSSIDVSVRACDAPVNTVFAVAHFRLRRSCLYHSSCGTISPRNRVSFALSTHTHAQCTLHTQRLESKHCKIILSKKNATIFHAIDFCGYGHHRLPRE